MTFSWTAFFLVVISAVAHADRGDSSTVIDQHVEMAASRDGVQLTEPVTDAVFLRRISLDLIGRIPDEAEQAVFLDNPDREMAVDRLLDSPDHALFWSRLWTTTLLGMGQSPQVDRESLRQWLESCFARDRSLDEIVFDLIGAEGRAAFDGPTNFILRHARDPVVPVGRLFLGVQLDCARCHDHPNDRWTQEDFQGMQRFFAFVRTRQPTPGSYEVFDAQADGAERPVFLTGSQPRTGRWRQELGLYVVRSKPFARAMVNRLWYHFFGHGISNPPDTVNGHSRSPDMDLINALADRFKQDDFRIRGLIRDICLSEAYRRRVSEVDPQWTMIPTVKPMTVDQLYDSLRVALDRTGEADRRREFIRAAVEASLDDTISNTWDARESVQTLMTRLNLSLGSHSLSHRQMFRRVLCREPSAEQLRLCRGRSSTDVMFALVHSNEFAFWH